MPKKENEITKTSIKHKNISNFRSLISIKMTSVTKLFTTLKYFSHYQIVRFHCSL